LCFLRSCCSCVLLLVTPCIRPSSCFIFFFFMLKLYDSSLKRSLSLSTFWERLFFSLSLSLSPTRDWARSCRSAGAGGQHSSRSHGDHPCHDRANRKRVCGRHEPVKALWGLHGMAQENCRSEPGLQGVVVYRC